MVITARFCAIAKANTSSSGALVSLARFLYSQYIMTKGA
jgi:hypothetical protein